MTRVLSGAVLVVVAVAVVWYASPLLFLAVAEILLMLACREYVAIARMSRLHVPAVLSTVAAAVTCATFTHLVAESGLASMLDVALLASFLMIGSYELVAWQPGTDAIGSASASAMPVLYLGVPIGAMVAVRELRGPQVLFLLMLSVIVSDTAQYYSGRAFGRRPLAPGISPKKTIEGAIGGFVFGSLALAGAGRWWLPEVPLSARILIGAAIVVAGIAGDLFESMLKRSAGVKDSSGLIPGHGGVLDRIDALLFAAPLYYVILKYV